MIFNQIKYTFQNNNIEFTANILSSIAGDKIMITLWVGWKKPVKCIIKLDPEDLEGAENLKCTGD